MKQYINKSTLVEKIEKQIEFGKFKCQQSQENNDRESYVAWSEHIATCGKILSLLNTLEAKVDSLDKFKTLQHITRDMKSTVEDWGYTPNLYHFDGSWHVDWIHCEDGDSIKGFDADTPEEAIDKASEWFHSTFCNG